jgi:hypothetical protein
MDRFSTEDGIFDGAYYSPRDYRSEDDIVCHIHKEDRLGIVRRKDKYFVAEFLKKGSPSWSMIATWNEDRDSCICGSREEGFSLLEQYFEDTNND